MCATGAVALTEGALVLVRWADITQSVDGDPSDAELTVWEQPGAWAGVKAIVVGGREIECVVIAGARTAQGIEDAGWTAIPLTLVLEVVPLQPAPGTEH